METQDQKETQAAGATTDCNDLLGGYPEPGTECTLNRGGDLFMVFEARPFIGAPCVVVKRTKAGLVQVALKDDPKSTFSAPLRNIEVTPNDYQNGDEDRGREASELHELLPCPFCGGRHIEHRIYMSGGARECMDCGAMGPETTPDYDDEASASAWNKRAG